MYITKTELEELAKYFAGRLDHALIHEENGVVVQVDLYKVDVDETKVTIIIEIPDNVVDIDKIEILNVDQKVAITRSVNITKNSNRGLMVEFHHTIMEVDTE
ncbi:hypothetical protein ACERJO_11815 [Halalkalibacter sp. AB-rgal2]|uniref:hypothetical protein n=1 Tax=Halalkalibacter sp. AB-rgal2 TaxID=3242695 RepID=UPI00359E3F2E